MSAQPIPSAGKFLSNCRAPSGWNLVPMQLDDLPNILTIENQVYSHPWTHGNFRDALANGYDGRVLRDQQGVVMGYFLLMGVVDEAHLLNLSVRLDRQHRGVGLLLLNEVLALARGQLFDSILLEVRPSNQRAIQLYQRFGFIKVGARRGYYPAMNNQREDAIVMRYLA